jgi:hypothetical protein
MVDVKPLDPEFPIQQQLGVDTGPVVLVNLEQIPIILVHSLQL